MTIPIALLMLAAQAAGAVQSKPGSPAQPKPGAPIVQVGVFSISPDGKQQAAAYDTSLTTETFQYIAGCVIGGGNRPVPPGATDAWKLSGKIESMTDDEAVVRIDWQRIRSAGANTTSPGGSVQLTLHTGDRVPLDSATPEPTAGCGARTVSFDARFEPRPGWIVGPRGPLTVSPEVTVMYQGSGGGAASGSGSGVSGGGGGGGRAVHAPNLDRLVDVSSRVFTADLFLVRTDKAHPDHREFNMQGVVLKDVKGTTGFTFSPFTIDTSVGPLTVQIGGSLAVTTEDGSPQLVFTTTRSVKYASNRQSRDATSNSSGSSTTRNAMPGPDDVLSFELPPIRLPNGSGTVPEQYSVRVRIR